MDKNEFTVGQRVEIDEVGEGTITGLAEGGEIEVAVSEVETYRVTPDQLSGLE